MIKFNTAKEALENQDIVIFETGSHTDAAGIKVEVTEKDIDSIVNSTNIKDVAIVIHHPSKNYNGLSSVESLKRVGRNLVARLKDTKENFADAIKSGLFPERSIKIDNGKLDHIGFLPVGINAAIKGMQPIQFSENGNTIRYNNNDINFKKEVSMDKVNEELLKQVTDLKVEIKEKDAKILKFEEAENVELAAATGSLATAEEEIRVLKEKFEEEKKAKILEVIEAKILEMGLTDQAEIDSFKTKMLGLSEKTEDTKEFSEFIGMVGLKKEVEIKITPKLQFEKKTDNQNCDATDYATKV